MNLVETPFCEENVVRETRRLLADAKRVLVITGAGISAESGVPTFRGAGEKWRDKHFTQLANPQAFEDDPSEIWDWYLYRRQIVTACQPNPAHVRLAEWAKRSPGVTLVTQNVDGLHELAGHPDVIRLHGSLWRNRCTGCGTEREDRSLAYAALPLSPCCRVLERPAIVWFGEAIPDQAFDPALAAFQTAEVVLVVGTSALVSPVASWLQVGSKLRKRLVEVNPEPALFVDFTARITASASQAIPLLLP